jgi:hypothetical protein
MHFPVFASHEVPEAQQEEAKQFKAFNETSLDVSDSEYILVAGVAPGSGLSIIMGGL